MSNQTEQNEHVRQEKILKDVQSIVQQCVGHCDITVYLFGSWARQEVRRSSDIDIAIDYEQSLPAGTITQLRSVLEDSTIPYHVEVLDLTKTEESFRQKVRKEGIRWSVCNNE